MTQPIQILDPRWPVELQHADFTRMVFALDFLTPCRGEPATFMQLRRPLRRAASRLFSRDSENDRVRMKALFDPALSEDPVALRKYQKPAPAFIVRPPLLDEETFDAGERLELEVLFLGTGVTLIRDFLATLSALGGLGLVEGEGRFEVTEVASIGLDGLKTTVWRQVDELDRLAPQVISLDQWLDAAMPRNSQVTLQFVTPVRLMADGRPLRAPHFKRLFPFMLRRVSSMLHAQCAVEVIDQPDELLATAAEVEEVAFDLAWQDWRSLGSVGAQAVGGFVGSLTLAGAALESLMWVLSLAGLFGLGKGAAYGAGHCVIYE